MMWVVFYGVNFNAILWLGFIGYRVPLDVFDNAGISPAGLRHDIQNREIGFCDR